MMTDGWLIVQIAAAALAASVLLVAWGDLGGLAFVRRWPTGAKFLVGLLAIGGIIAAVVGPNYLASDRAGGKGAPLDLDWKLASVADGKEVNLSSFRGKVLFINIWATWCGPCVAEMPSIEQLYQNFAGRDDVAFLLISQDSTPGEALRFAAKQGMKAPIYFPVGPMPVAFQTRGIPATFIVRKDGKLHFADLGAKNWSSDTWVRDLETLTKERPVAEGTR
jgi:thiol-disulfide isomerase/thioredoxin